MGPRKGGIVFDGPSVKLARPRIVVLCQSKIVLLPPQEVVIGDRTIGVPISQNLLVFLRQLELQCSRDAGCHVVLNFEDVSKLAIVPLGP